MPGPDLPETPAPLKGIQHYLKIACEHDERDPVVSYWARLYSLQTGLKISTKTAAENSFLLKLMDWLESTKKLLIQNEAITNEVAAQAHLENWALKLFLYADKNDRAGNFNKSVIQSFYTAGLLYDVLTTFGELSEEAAQNRKYAKWKAAYIHNCLKNGETPVPGPMKEEGEENDISNLNIGPGPDEDLLIDFGDDGEPAGADNGEEEKQGDEPSNEAEGESASPEQAEDGSAEPNADPEEKQDDEAIDEPEGESATPEPAEEGPSEPDADPEEKQDDEPIDEPEGESATPEPAEEGLSEPDADPEEKEGDEPPNEPEGEPATPEPAEEGPSEPGADPVSVDGDAEAPKEPTPPSSTDAYGFPSVPDSTTPQAPNISYPSLPTPVVPNPYNPAPTPTSPTVPQDFSATPQTAGGATLDAEQMIKASKYIKWAGSAINYDDVPTAVTNLQKALHLLTTGQDS